MSHPQSPYNPPSEKNLLLPFEGHDVRSRLAIDGVPWFVASDVCEALGYTNPREALKKHVDDDDKGVTIRDTLSGGTQRMAEINESGLYSLILRSRKPAAKRFKRWVTSEVLPALRQTGGYGANQHTDQTEAELAKLNSDMEVMRHEQALILAYQRQILASQTRAHEAKTAPVPAPAPEPAQAQAQAQAPIPSNNDPEMARLITIVRKHLPPPGETVSNLDVASWISPGKKRQLDQALDTILFLLVHDGTLQLQRAWTNRRGRLGMMYRVGGRASSNARPEAVLH